MKACYHFRGAIMIERKKIDAFVDSVVRQFKPERVVLFGSHVSGRTGADSDVDLLVIMRHSGPAARQAALIRQSVRSGFPLDLIVRTPEKIRRRLAMGDGFIREILENGRVLYEDRHPRVD